MFKNHLQKDDYSAFLEFIPSLIQKYPSVTKIVSEFNVKKMILLGILQFETPKKGKKIRMGKISR